jgi:hypothetical protein
MPYFDKFYIPTKTISYYVRRLRAVVKFYALRHYLINGVAGNQTPVKQYSITSLLVLCVTWQDGCTFL